MSKYIFKNSHSVNLDKFELLSTESNATPNVDVSQNSLYPTPKNTTWSSVEFFEKARKNKEKLSQEYQDQEDPKQSCGFWSDVAGFFNPFKCDKK